jgi:integrase
VLSDQEIDVRKTVNIAAALAAASSHEASELTLSELVHACAAAKLDGCDLRLRKWLEAFGSQSAWAITAEQLEIAAQAMLDAGYKPSTANRDLSSLGTIYRWARERRLSPRGFRSPTLGVRRFEEGIRRVELSREEIEALRARSLGFRDRRFSVFVALLIDTGARKSELLGRRWAEVDLERCEIHCPTTKTGVPRVLHFRHETALLMGRVFKTRRAEGLVFEGRVPGEPISFRRAWSITVASIKRPDLHMHDIRHAAAANLLRAGVTLGVAAQVLGHDPAVLARRYGHLETSTLRKAQERAWEVSA